MKTLPAKHYFIALTVIGLLLFTLLSLNLVWRAEAIQQAVAAERELRAGAELERGVDTILRELQRVTKELSEWDEVHQQLFDPTYYVYWRETRQGGDYLPDYVTGFELYGTDRTALVKLPNQPMPGSMPETSTFLSTSESALFSFAPISSRTGEAPSGYLGIKFDLLKALDSLVRFSEIDPATLTVETRGSHLVLPGQVPSHISYSLLPESGGSALGDLLLNSLRDYFILFTAMMLLFYLLVTTLLIRPLRRLNRHILDLQKGQREDGEQSNTLLPAVEELTTAWRSLDNYQQDLDNAQLELDHKNTELWRLAHIDALTGINNRHAFEHDWNELLHVARDTRMHVSLALFDCDFFKAINDTYGHKAGDQVLQSIASQLESVLRRGDRLYRLGGDEFVVLFINSSEEETQYIAERCSQAVQNHAFEQIGIKEALKLSVGLAHASGDDTANLSELPRQADVAMYHAKGATRDKIVHYHPDLEQDAYALVSNRIVSAVLHAIETGDNIAMHYQPLVDASTHMVSHYEALVRIDDADGLITPADIFPIVTRRRLEVELDKAVLRSIARDLASGLFPNDTGVAINVSAAMLALSDFCEHFSVFMPHLKDHPIIIEVTETNFITHLQHASECLGKLRANGFVIAIDDFGSGYSSIRYLANMPADIVKFDISMVQALESDERNRSIITDAANLIHNAGYTLIAEGIEDQQTLRRVMELHPTYLQGFLFGRPQPLQDLAKQPSHIHSSGP